jgi:septum formation protein
LVLASASPRRKELLSELVGSFLIDPADLDEDALTIKDPRETAERLAEAKARLVALDHAEDFVLGADTVVACRGVQLAKPNTDAEACAMLGLLSGKTHQVFTGVALIGPGFERVSSEVTQVTFRSLDEEEISAYVATGDPMDKAGGYGIQGGAKGFVARIEGSFTNVIGLPVDLVREMLIAAKVLDQ